MWCTSIKNRELGDQRPKQRHSFRCHSIWVYYVVIEGHLLVVNEICTIILCVVEILL